MNHPRPAIADVLAPGRVAPVRIAPRPAVAPRTFHLLHGARGVAALAVVIFHYNHFYLADHTARDALPAVEAYPYAAILAPIYQHGDFAVELFWVISGFVFAHAYLNRPTSPWRFAVARVARLYPLHLLTLLLVAGLQAASLAFAGHWQIYGNNDLHHFVLQLFFASNSVSVSHGLSFNGPIWSVSLEILVYAAFFLALWPLRRGGLWAAGAIAALCWGAYLAPVTPPVISKMVLLCAGYFFLGTLVYGAYGGWMRLPWVLALSLAGVVAGAWFEIRGLVEPAAATGLVALLALSGERLEALGQRLTPLGDLSYSLYLIHVPLQIALLLVADLALGGTRSFAETAWLLPVFLAVSMGLAHLTYHGFERPAGRWVKAALLPRRA